MPSVSTKAGGTCFAFPDVCLVPSAPGPIPTPFPNTGACCDAQGTVDTVLVQNKETIVETSTIPMSSGDEAGTGGGVVSGVFLGPVKWKTASAKVYAKGKRVALHGGVTSHNGTSPNAPVGQQVGASQGKVTASS